MIEIYCDESRQDLFYNKNVISDNNRYIFIGGIMFDREHRESIKKQINDLKSEYKINKKCELKWNRVTIKYIDLYKKMVDIYVENKIDFRAICIDSLKINLEKYHNDDAELGFYKYYYQLLNHWLNSNNKYMIYTDIKTNKNPNVLNDLKRCLNGIEHYDVVDRIYAIDSHESIFLQLEDIIMGATSYRINYGYNGKSKAKNIIVNYLEERLGHKIQPTARNTKKFNLFNIKLRDE